MAIQKVRVSETVHVDDDLLAGVARRRGVAVKDVKQRDIRLLLEMAIEACVSDLCAEGRGEDGGFA